MVYDAGRTAPTTTPRWRRTGSGRRLAATQPSPMLAIPARDYRAVTPTATRLRSIDTTVTALGVTRRARA